MLGAHLRAKPGAHLRTNYSHSHLMLDAEVAVGGEWAEWYRLTPTQRWSESRKLWQQYLAMGGKLDPEPDTQSPFYFPEASGTVPADGRTSVRSIRSR